MVAKILSEKDYKNIFSKVPRLCVDLLVKVDNGVLLSKRLIPPFKNFWHFPGGRVFYRESVEKAIQRTAKAELGVSVKIKKLIGFMEFLKDGKFVHSVSLVFLVIPNSKDIKGGKQAKEFKIFDSIRQDIHPVQKKFLAKHWEEIKS